MLIKFQMAVFIRKLFTTELIAIACRLASGWCAIEKQSMEDFEVPWCIRGYHIYKYIWHAAIGQHLSCRREPDNTSDRYAVAVIKDGIIIGHLLRKISKVSSLILRRGGSICCIVTGGRRYSADLPQGGLEIPCGLLFKGKVKEIQKLRVCMKRPKNLFTIIISLIY